MEAPFSQMIQSATLLFVLLNPFLMSIYLLNLIETLEHQVFNRVMIRGTLIATAVFVLFAAGGDAIFSRVLQVRFASFILFGGVVFLLIAIRYVQVGPTAIQELRGHPERVAGAIAMPFMVGPGTISASILAGARLPFLWAAAAIVLAMMATVLGVSGLKWLHGRVKNRYRALVDRYVDIVGRVAALHIGTTAVDMILNGIELWLGRNLAPI